MHERHRVIVGNASSVHDHVTANDASLAVPDTRLQVVHVLAPQMTQTKHILSWVKVARVLQQNSDKLPEKYRNELEELKEKEAGLMHFSKLSLTPGLELVTPKWP